MSWRYVTDALTKEEALEILRKGQAKKQERIANVTALGYPAYTTSAGWLGECTVAVGVCLCSDSLVTGYSDAKVERLVREALGKGFHHIKVSSKSVISCHHAVSPAVAGQTRSTHDL